MKRRGFLIGLGAAFAAPAIVRAEVIMPVRSLFKPDAPLILGIDWGSATDSAALVVRRGNEILSIDVVSAEALRLLRNNLFDAEKMHSWPMNGGRW